MQRVVPGGTAPPAPLVPPSATGAVSLPRFRRWRGFPGAAPTALALPDIASGRRIALADRPSAVPHTGGTLGQGDLLDTIRAAVQDRYAVVDEIGRGGMATVYHATDLRHRRPVALKLLFPELARAVGGERFLREISILARLSHPNILPLLDSGTVEVVPGLPVPWYVMPFVADDSLRVRLAREGPLPLEAALRYTRDLCSALAHAHGQGYIHRDIKPENILLQGDHAVLADFGIARAVTVAGGGTLSSSGLVVGTPTYMSPEQSVGSERLDARSDLYSLGCVLYEMLAGQPPFTGATPQAISARHQFEPLPPIRVVRPTVPERVERLLEAALAKTPADRIGSAQEFERQLVEAQRSGEVALGAPVRTALADTRRGARRRRSDMIASFVIVLVLAVGSAVIARRGGGAKAPERLAVFPFAHRDTRSRALVSGVDCELLVYQALDGYEDLGRVDRLVVASAMDRSGVPHDLESAARMALSLGAARFIWGDVWQNGDSLWVRGVLVALTGGAPEVVYRSTIALPVALAEAGGTLVAQRFAQLALQLALRESADPAIATIVSTKSFSALRLLLQADSALWTWQLDTAAARYRRALRADPSYPLAYLRLAQIERWKGTAKSDWEPLLSAALREPGRLPPRDRRLAEAALALATGDDPAACRRLREILADDSTDVSALIDLGDCIRGDDAVVPDSGSGGGLRFRTSLFEAGELYATALRLAPAAHRAFETVVGWRLAATLFTSPAQRRYGRLAADSSQGFFAPPHLEAESIAFVPRPIRVEGRMRVPAPRVDQGALEWGRQSLAALAATWTERFPSSSAAWEARAKSLEVAGLAQSSGQGSPTALVLRALELATRAEDARRLRQMLVRLQVKREEFVQAVANSDTLLRQSQDVPSGEAMALAPFAALRGRPDQAWHLLRRGGGSFLVTSGQGAVLDVPDVVRESAEELYVLGSMGVEGDSFAVIEHRLERQLRQWAPRAQQSEAVNTALLLPAVLAFPVQGIRAVHRYPHDWYLPMLQEAAARGDDSAVRRALAEIDSSRRDIDQGDLAPEIVFQEAWLRLATGDTTGAAQQLDQYLGGLGSSRRLDLLDQVQSAAGLLRIYRLRSQLPGDPRATDRWARAAQILTAR